MLVVTKGRLLYSLAVCDRIYRGYVEGFDSLIIASFLFLFIKQVQNGGPTLDANFIGGLVLSTRESSLRRR